jgi:hypothetical protein
MSPKECRDVPIRNGDVYHRWTIVCQVANVENFRAALCRCGCGAEQVVKFAYLYRGKSRQCARCAGSGRCRVYVAEPGDRYGPKTIIREDGYIGPHRAVLVRCDCGTEQRYSFAKIRNGVGKECCAK